MKKIGLLLFVMLLLSACGPAAVPSAIPSAPPIASSVPADTALAALATEIPKSASPNSTPASAGVCTLVSKDEISTILGEAVVEERNPDKKGIICVYQTKNLILELNTMHAFGGWGNSVEYMKQTRVNGVGLPKLDVPGLGDEAFYNGSAAYRLLLVRKGDTVYSLGIRNVTADQSISSPDNGQALEKAVAGLVLSHLP
jgi:hypothetical protein